MLSYPRSVQLGLGRGFLLATRSMILSSSSMNRSWPYPNMMFAKSPLAPGVENWWYYVRLPTYIATSEPEAQERWSLMLGFDCHFLKLSWILFEGRDEHVTNSFSATCAITVVEEMPLSLHVGIVCDLALHNPKLPLGAVGLVDVVCPWEEQTQRAFTWPRIRFTCFVWLSQCRQER
jgi:hypothetical protein